ncbi:major histocompatibility complex class I-related gene protein-like [Chanos chanos]|uniref:Major histocompatibility complex class I-related gene protein-like n=1 Tax=Chanos chanos TaxID=29144 RepID=A0A6J2WLL9_CHACN|nr:major histocompatibility complex class I-related gene protein-like [Chanos chanos]
MQRGDFQHGRQRQKRLQLQLQDKVLRDSQIAKTELKLERESFILLAVYRDATKVHSLDWYFVASQGFDLPDYFEVVTVDDIQVYYFDSNMKGDVPLPEWLSSTTARQHWNFIHSRTDFNKRTITEALKSATQQFNLTGISSDVNIYQGYGGCHLHPDGTVQGFLTHAFNGKDFVSLDSENKRFTAAVPQAVLYKTLRDRNQDNLQTLVTFYNTRWCADVIKEFQQQNPQLHMKKAPEILLSEKRKSATTEITCHVTGFYPRTVQVQWFGSDMQPVVEEVDSENKVLPNGDGTYQIRKSVVIPAEHTDIHHYSCVVQHSSIPGNITKAWGKILLNPILIYHF